MLGRLRGHVPSKKVGGLPMMGGLLGNVRDLQAIELGGLPMLTGVGGHVSSNLMRREGCLCWEGLEVTCPPKRREGYLCWEGLEVT